MVPAPSEHIGDAFELLVAATRQAGVASDPIDRFKSVLDPLLDFRFSHKPISSCCIASAHPVIGGCVWRTRLRASSAVSGSISKAR